VLSMNKHFQTKVPDSGLKGLGPPSFSQNIHSSWEETYKFLAQQGGACLLWDYFFQYLFLWRITIVKILQKNWFFTQIIVLGSCRKIADLIIAYLAIFKKKSKFFNFCGSIPSQSILHIHFLRPGSTDWILIILFFYTR